MVSQPYALTKVKAKRKAVVTGAAVRATQARQKPAIPAIEPAAPPPARLLACVTQAKHRRLTEMLRDLRFGAEALSANADSLLSRLS